MSLPTTNLVARFDSAGITQSAGSFTGWTDSSGNGNHITSVPAAPAVVSLRGKTIVRFNGAQTFDLPSSIAFNSQSLSYFAVVRTRDTASLGVFISPAGGQVATMFFNGGTISLNSGGAIGTTFAPGLVNRYLLGMRCSASSVKMIMGAEAQTLSAFPASSGTGGCVGRWSNGGSLPVNDADIEALFVYSAAISDADLQLLRDYCVATYGVGSATPSLYMVCEGDSLTAGTTLTTPGDFYWPRIFCELLASEPKVDNVAHGGDTIFDISGTQGSQSDNLLTKGSAYTRKVSMPWAGTNDLNSGSPAATVLANHDTFRSDRLAAGFTEVWGSTPLPRIDETARQAFIALIAASGNWTGRLIRPDLDSRIGPNGANANPTYYNGDQVHLNNTGQAIYAALVAALISPAVVSQSGLMGGGFGRILGG